MTIWQQKISKNVFCDGSFIYVLTAEISFFRPQNTQVLRVLLMPHWEKLRVTVSKQINSKIFFALKGLGMYFIIYCNDTLWKISFAMEVWGMCLLYVKKFFQPHQWRLFFFRPQKTRILLFLVKLVWGRKGQIKTFPKIFFAWEVLSMHLTYVRKIFQMQQWSFSLFSPENTIFSFSLYEGMRGIKSHSLRTKLFLSYCLYWKYWICIYLM